MRIHGGEYLSRPESPRTRSLTGPDVRTTAVAEGEAHGAPESTAVGDAPRQE
ncbi:hypothetical protein ABZX93_01670 [Streptomyces sp. NPDC006632]|uniref:hypothetical protein n=1 Tax=Streptomyces sp. NPDC006632 TaxID=3157182 RepID=UPI0033A03FD0